MTAAGKHTPTAAERLAAAKFPMTWPFMESDTKERERVLTMCQGWIDAVHAEFGHADLLAAGVDASEAYDDALAHGFDAEHLLRLAERIGALNAAIAKVEGRS